MRSTASTPTCGRHCANRWASPPSRSRRSPAEPASPSPRRMSCWRSSATRSHLRHSWHPSSRRPPLTGSPLLERIAAGTVATLAWSGVTGARNAPVGVTWADGKLTGSVSPVLYGDVAEILLVVAEHDGGIGLFTLDPATGHPDARGRTRPDDRLRRPRLRQHSRRTDHPRRHRGSRPSPPGRHPCGRRPPGRLRPTRPRPDRRVRQAARAVRPDDRVVPGAQAPDGRPARQGADVPSRCLGCRAGRRQRRAERRAVGRRRRLILRRCRDGGRRRDDPAARRHRDHLGARRAPGVQARARHSTSCSGSPTSSEQR